MSANKKSGIVKINKAMCKGCGICVHFCPTKVLEMKEFKASVEHDGCIGCMMCELRCPDFAIEVEVIEPDKREEY